MQRIIIALFCSIWLLLFATEAQSDCDLTPRLARNSLARVSPGDPNNLRDMPSTSGELIGAIPGGHTLMVLDDAICADGFYWWQVNYDGLTGWTVEGNAGIYWLEPYQFPCETQLWHGQPATANREITVYNSPSLEADTLTTLQAGDGLEVGTRAVCPRTETERPFATVLVDGEIGWIEATGWNGSEQFAVDVAVVDANPRPLPVVDDAQQRLRDSIVTPPPLSDNSIRADNLAQLQVTQSIGEGFITDFVWSADSTQLIVATTLDARLYPADNFNALPQVFDGHDTTITAIALSPDSNTLITGDNSGRLIRHNALSGEAVRTIELDAPVINIAFRPDGRWFSVITASSQDSTLHSYLFTDNGLDHAYSTTISAGNVVNATLAFTPDNRYQVVIAGESVAVWDMQQGSDQPEWTESLSGLLDMIRAWSLHPSGTSITLLIEQACCEPQALNYDYILRTYNIANGGFISGMELDRSPTDYERRSEPMAIGYTPDGGLWWREGDQLTQLRLNSPDTLASPDSARQLSFINPAGTIGAIAGDSGEIRLFNLTTLDVTPDPYNVLYGIVGSVNQQAFSPDGTRIAARGRDNTLRVWDVASGQRQGTIRLHTVTAPVAVASNRLYSGATVWDTRSGQLLETPSGIPSGSIFARQVTTDGRVLTATQSATEPGVIWDAVTGEIVYQLESFIGRDDIAFSYDGRYIGYAFNHQAIIVEPTTGESIATLSPQYGYLSDFAFSPDNSLLLMYELPRQNVGDASMLVREITTGDLLVNVQFESLVDRTVVWSPDGGALSWIEFTLDDDTPVYEYRVYDVLTQSTQTWQLTVSLPALPDIFRLSAGGDILIVGMTDGSLQFYDTQSGNLLHGITQTGAQITDIRFNEDFSQMYIVGADGIVRVWAVME